MAREDPDDEHLAAAEAALDRCQTLIDDLLSLAREGRGVEGTEPVDLPTVVERAWGTVETGDATLATDTDRSVVADRSRLRQLLENLIRNALDHGDSGVTITVGDVEGGFYFEDDGPGIPEGIQEEVFSPAYSTAEGNTGFGLAIVEGIADAHGWNVSIRAAGSGGARFEITGVNPA